MKSDLQGFIQQKGKALLSLVTKMKLKKEDYFSLNFHSHGQRGETVNRRWLYYRQ